MTRRPRLLLVLPVLLLAGGCSGRPPPAAAETRPAAVKLHSVDPAGLRAVLARHRGRVVLVDFWATWCQPCAEWFPHTVDLQRRLACRGLTVISLSLDDPDHGAAVQDFLSRQGAVGENLTNRDGASAESFEAYGIRGGLPQLQLYDRRGTLRKTFAADAVPIELRGIERAVGELLDEGK
jgi:thiol-disulfide isomerase/thioredoxin